MSLAAGTRLGSYEILGPLGAGGMGEVYRAADSTLKRQVAVKILPPAMAADPERLARFQREAEVLASLNHPHIAAIYEHASNMKALEAAHAQGVIHRDLKPANIKVREDGTVKVLEDGAYRRVGCHRRREAVSPAAQP